jgi:hypothetical protein
LFAVLGELAGVAHLALVQHALCLEHGEFVHSDERGSWSAVPHKESVTPTLRARDDAAAEHGHAHCSTAAHRREALRIEAAASEGVTPPAAFALAWPPCQAQSFGQAILRFAPKCSPPG